MPVDFSRTALYYPDRRPVFVAVDVVPPFDAGDTGFSLGNAWWLANLCQLAYSKAGDIEQALQGVGWQLLKFFEGQSTQGFLAAGTGFAILTFRGTEIEQWLDIRADATFGLIEFRGVPDVHGGFLAALDEVWPEVEAALDPLMAQGIPVWYTGYSLGAALATLAAARRLPVALYTFGSPRVGDLDFVRRLQDLPVQRFANCCDIVTQVPPSALGYWHVGQQGFITAGGRILRNPDSWHVARRQLLAQLSYAVRLPWLRRGLVTMRSLADHAIVNYIAGIESEMQVPR